MPGGLDCRGVFLLALKAEGAGAAGVTRRLPAWFLSCFCRSNCRLAESTLGCRDFAPAGDLLSCQDKKVGKEAAPNAWPLRGPLRCSASPGRAQLTSLRSVQTGGAKSALEGASRRPSNPVLLAQATRGAPNGSLRVASVQVQAQAQAETVAVAISAARSARAPQADAQRGVTVFSPVEPG